MNMFTPVLRPISHRILICVFGVLVATAYSLHAKLDINRIEPVPAGESILAVDFFPTTRIFESAIKPEWHACGSALFG